MKEEIYRIEGMSCAACSSAVERVTRKLGGVERSDVNLTTERMTIVYDETKLDAARIMQKVEKAGFGIRLYEKEAGKGYGTESRAGAVENVHGAPNTPGDITEAERKQSIYGKAETSKSSMHSKFSRNQMIGSIIATVILLYVSMGQMLPVPLPVPDIINMHTMPTNYALTQLLLTIPVLYFGRKFLSVD